MSIVCTTRVSNINISAGLTSRYAYLYSVPIKQSARINQYDNIRIHLTYSLTSENPTRILYRNKTLANNIFFNI